jgi:hypothetical protein
MRKMYFVFVIALLLSACATTSPTPAVSVGAVQTSAVQTVIAMAKQTQAASLPTATEAPTQPPLPTETFTPEPQPIKFTGTGSKVIDINKWPGVALAQASYDGGDNFIVEQFDASNNNIGILFNGLYNYHGTKLLDEREGESTSRLQVKTTGAWTIEILPLTSAPVINAPGTLDGQDDAVLLVTGTPDLLKYKVGGDSNFIVYAMDKTGANHIAVNEIAPIEGSSILSPQTILLVVNGTGKWHIELTAK